MPNRVLPVSPRGGWAEALAEEVITAAGLTVLERNYRVRGGEIDLIAREPGGILVFVEVKQRAKPFHGLPGEYIDFRKAARVRRTALFYLGRDDLPCRFDAVLVSGTEAKHKLEWLRDAF